VVNRSFGIRSHHSLELSFSSVVVLITLHGNTLVIVVHIEIRVTGSCSQCYVSSAWTEMKFLGVLTEPLHLSSYLTG